jgi:hypothetical protein
MQGFIYCLKSPHTDKVYIGSTKQTLTKRFIGHKKEYNLFQNGKLNYTSSYDILACSDAYIELIEAFESITKQELLKKEGEYIQSMKSVNRRIARGLVKGSEEEKQHKKQYYILNREVIAKRVQDYRNNNREAYNEYMRQYNLKKKLLGTI